MKYYIRWAEGSDRIYIGEAVEGQPFDLNLGDDEYDDVNKIMHNMKELGVQTKADWLACLSNGVIVDANETVITESQIVAIIG